MHDALGLFLAQVLAIVAVARLLGKAMSLIGQPAVVGEMLAGVVLGPTLFGALAPSLHGMLFAPASLGSLQLASQLGVILYLYTLGLDLDPRDLRSPGALGLSLSGMLLPFALGVGCAVWLHGLGWTEPGKSTLAFALFLGVAMSITAFPVLSRILSDRGLQGTGIGKLALAAAALGDVVAWCALAVVETLGRTGSLAGEIPILAGLVVFAVLTLFVVRPLLARLVAWKAWDHSPTQGTLSLFVLIAFGFALCTQGLGIHALFGAFLAGVITPGAPALRTYLHKRLEGFAGAILLPLFFAWTGLRTEFAGFQPEDVLVFSVLLAAAVGGKLLGSIVPVRLYGASWNDGVRVGILMNTRGLMELVALNVGLDLGILPPRVFALMVMMAVATTLMTGPTLSLWERVAKGR